MDKLTPPQRPFAGEGSSNSGGGYEQLQQDAHYSHSRSGSAANTDSPPITPRSMTFQQGTSGGPFSPTSATFSPAHTPSGSLHVPVTAPPSSHFANAIQHPDSPRPKGLHSLSNSYSELPRNSSSLYGSRPNTPRREAFSSPRTRPLTMYSTIVPSSVKIKKELPKSTMLDKEKPIEKPWAEGPKDPLNRIAYFLTYGVMFLGIILGAVRCYFGWTGVPMIKGKLCPVMDESFDRAEGIFGENGKFVREVDMSGFGNGEFQMTTDSDDNSYIKDGKLYITPTFTSDLIGEDAIIDGHVFNITGCTFNITRKQTYTSQYDTTTFGHSIVQDDQEFDVDAYTRACSAVSNSTTGSVINPIRSARISTRLSASMKFGRVEVRAKIPRGDWLWPAIWMLPVDNKYGGWPLSGEIDIMEARGNGPEYDFQGTNYVRGSLNWGPSPGLNRAYKTYGWWNLRRGSYDTDFHTYALEWDEDFIRIYVDNRLHHMLNLKMKKRSFWELGKFPKIAQIGGETVMVSNVWENGTSIAPFDEKFYLIMNVAVGGTNGWFPDDKKKPWLDGSPTAMGEFWRAREEWRPTWGGVEDRSLIVDSVKMWEKC